MDNNYKIECSNCEFEENIEPCVNCYNHDKFVLSHKIGKANKKVGIIACLNCKHKNILPVNYPCNKCFEGKDERFTGAMWESDEEEINSPSRYNKNGFECIEVMIAIFGKEAVRQFCKLNAFKYIWRESDKGKVNDIKKANYYLKKYVELSSESPDKC